MTSTRIAGTPPGHARTGSATAVNEANKQYIIEAGGVVRTLTPEQRQRWVDEMKPVWKQFEKDIGIDSIAAAQSYNK